MWSDCSAAVCERQVCAPATGFKAERCNCGHDDSSETHLLRVWERVGSGLTAVIVERASVRSHVVFTDDAQVTTGC